MSSTNKIASTNRKTILLLENDYGQKKKVEIIFRVKIHTVIPEHLFPGESSQPILSCCQTQQDAP